MVREGCYPPIGLSFSSGRRVRRQGIMLINRKQLSGQTGFLLLLLAGILVVMVTGAQAQDVPPTSGNGNYDASDTSQDPPTRVARLSYLEGSVSFQPNGQGDWGAATRNRPVTVGDKIWSDNNSRAELQAGQTSIHLGSMTALSFLNLDEQTTQMRLAEGTINFRVREIRQGDVYEVDTPNVAFNVTQAGAFDVDVNENGDGTLVTAIRGEGQVTANGQTYTIHAGERGEFNGTDKVTYTIAAAPAPDDFDRWANSRDLRDDNSVSAQYVSRDVPGYSDLDENGTWNEEPDYGPVWYPSTVDVGWAPYSYGNSNYVGPWGWTWVGYEPWGFAPYHYGRWAYIGNRWGWCPGPYYAAPIYGPAFVGFIGGSSWSVGFGFGGGYGVGWFPLGFGEPFCPWYRSSDFYYRNVNINNTYIRNTTIINNRVNNYNYAYAHNTNAVTVTSRNNFVNGQTVRPGDHHITAAALRGAPVNTRVNIPPTRQSYFGAAGAHGNIARPSAAIQNRPVMARTTPAAAASHMPVRTLSGAGSQPGRGTFNGDNAAIAQRPVMGRAAQTAAAANNNRPSFAQGNRGSQTNPQSQITRPGTTSQNNPGITARQRELSLDKPQSQQSGAPSYRGFNHGANSAPNNGGNRNWSAQGNATDRGRAPSGFSSANPPRSEAPRNSAPRDTAPSTTAMTHNDRPPFATGSTRSSGGYSVSPRSSVSSNRPDYSNSNRGNVRSHEPPQRSSGYSTDRPAFNSNSSRGYSQPPSYDANPNRGYSQPRSYNPPTRSSSPSYSSSRGYSAPRSYSAPPAPSRSYSAPSRSYSAPGRSYSAPSRGYSAPSRSSGGGGGPHGGGGSPRGGGSHGGGSSHGRR